MVTGIIYKLVCNETNMVYYGSTQQSLDKRIRGHKSGCKEWKAGKRRYTTSFSIIERGNYSYSLIETVECEDKHQLERRERYYIENNACVNKCFPCRTDKEYKIDNKEIITEQWKAYYEVNKDAINERKRRQRAEQQRQRRAELKQLKENIF